MKKIDGRTREGRILARKRAAMAKARRALAKLRRERKKVITPGEAIKVTGEWLSPEVVRQMEVAPKMQEDMFFAYGPPINGGQGKASVAYWREIPRG